MSAVVMDGRALAARVLEATRIRAEAFEVAAGRRACLATVLIGDDPASRTYVQMKGRRCRSTGLDAQHHELPTDATTAQAVDLVASISADPAVDGILVQHPAPAQVDEAAVFEAIAPAKDVDGVTAASFAAMGLDRPGFASCTPAGIMRLLDAYGIDPAGRHAVVIGRSPILGKPLSLLLLARDATVTVCHSRTRDLATEVSRADLVVAAAGRPGLVAGEWIAPGATVIDAGYASGGAGDVQYAVALERAAFLTPVPGGVGPMTIAVLLDQTVDAAQARLA